MSNFTLAAGVLAGVLAVIGLLTAPFDRWIYRSDLGTQSKLTAYGITLVLQWTLAAAAVWIDGWALLLHSSAAPASWLPVAAIAGPALGAATAAYFTIALLPLLQGLRGPRWRSAYAAAIRRALSTLPGLLPNTAAERAAFVLLSLTAGVCEEVLYRGFLIRFLHEGALALPVAAALAVSSVAFGLGHAYQGFKGVLTTTACGLGLGLLFLLTGSLIPAVVLHALIDLQLVYVLRPTPGQDAAAAPEAA
jgi:membrane protease YdiL (CAAX protease family)